MSNHKLTQIFYDGLGPQDRYLLDAASGGTFMSKFENYVMELIEMVAENSHHNVAKPFERGVMPKGQLIDAKSVEMEMLLERIDRMAEVHAPKMIDKIFYNGSEGLMPILLQEVSPWPNCSRLDHVELDSLVVVVQGQGMF